eukprot:COSAG01_NODE_36298_length_519_cov_2.357143_1_plen_45_part_10
MHAARPLIPPPPQGATAGGAAPVAGRWVRGRAALSARERRRRRLL